MVLEVVYIPLMLLFFSVTIGTFEKLLLLLCMFCRLLRDNASGDGKKIFLRVQYEAREIHSKMPNDQECIYVLQPSMNVFIYFAF